MPNVISNPLTDQQARPDWAGHQVLAAISPEQIKCVRSIVELKRKFEDIARRWKSLDAPERAELTRLELSPQMHAEVGQLVYAFQPGHFAFAALGLQGLSYVVNRIIDQKINLSIDPWLVLGGLRKPHWFDMPEEKLRKWIPAMDLDTTNNNLKGDGSLTCWFSPFPLFIAEEGKNRIQRYQDFNIPLYTKATIWEFAPAHSLRLYRSKWHSNVWGVRYVGGSELWDRRIEEHMRRCSRHRRDQGSLFSVMPFPEVGVPLLQAYGVQQDNGWAHWNRLTVAAQKRESKKVRSYGWS